MTHQEIEELLGAYALDALEADERETLEGHLAECPRCRAEVAAHFETAALLGNAGGTAPAGLWDRIGSVIALERPAEANPAAPVLDIGEIRAAADRAGRERAGRPTRRPLAGRVVLSLAACAAAVAILLLGLDAQSLHRQLNSVTASIRATGLRAAVASASAGPHRTIHLESAGRDAATLIVTPTDEAYWVTSSLRRLGASKTYQIWGLDGGKVVSLALVGPDPRALTAFRLSSSTTRIMVTAEPAGGTSGPTTPVLASAVARLT
jgi:anti-sigma factor RsiW